MDGTFKEYKLRRGDILRIGRVQLKVKDYRVECSKFPEDQNSSPVEDNIVDLQSKEDKPATVEDTCRICFCTEANPDNPLLSICNCTGSMKFIHYICLKTWLHSNSMEKVNSQIISHLWSSFHCEVCTAIYPCIIYNKLLVSITHSGRRFDMVDIPKPLNDDFLLLEAINQDKTAPRAIHLIIPSKMDVGYKLGRGHEADIKISDISVSRLHASINYTRQGFILQSIKAKFGTLLLQKNDPSFNFDEQPTLQFGRTKIEANIRNSIAKMYNKFK